MEGDSVFDAERINRQLEKVEYAEEMAIGFHKFIVSQSFHYDYRGETFNRISEKDKFYTHKELYQLYVQSKQKTS